MATTADSVVVNLEARTDQYNAKINQAATNFQNATNKIESNTARIGNAQRNLGRQVADVGASLSSGASPFLILGQQAGQVADALADTGGRAAKVAAFFAGPWGAALLAAGSVLAIFAEKAYKAGDSVDSLVAKLQENARKTELSAEAQRIFEGTLEGALEASRKLTGQLQDQNKSQLQVAQSALAAAAAQRQLALQTIKAETSKIALAQSDLQVQRQIASQNGGSLRMTGANANIADLDRQIAGNRVRLAQANKLLESAQKGVVEGNIAIIKTQAAEQSDKSAAAVGRHTRAVDKLTDAFRRGKLTVGQYRSQLADANRQLDADRSAGGSSRASGGRPSGSRRQSSGGIADFNRGIRNDEAFNNELEQLNQQIIAAQRQRATTAQEEADFERQTIQSDFRKRQQQIAADLSANKFDATQAATLNERNEYAKALKLRNVAINEDIRTLQEIAEGQRVDIGVLQESAQARLQIAESQEERKNIELELVRLKYQERKEQLEILKQQAVIRGDIQAQANINRQLEALPDLRRAEEVGVAQRNRGRYENYRRNIDSADSLADSIDGIKIQTLEAVTDELTNATKAALGLKGAFGDIVGELIRIGIQRKIIGPLADGLFGKADGSTEGQLGGFLSSLVSSLGKRASGGNTRGGGAYLVGENGPELFAPSGSGKIYPTGALGSPSRAGGNTIVQQTFVLDNRGGITTPQLIDYVNRTANASATRAGQTAFNSSPLRSAQIEAFGT